MFILFVDNALTRTTEHANKRVSSRSSAVDTLYSFSYISKCRNGRVVTVSISQGVPRCKLRVRVPSDIVVFFLFIFFIGPIIDDKLN